MIVLSSLYFLPRERCLKDSSQNPLLSTLSRMNIGFTLWIRLLLKLQNRLVEVSPASSNEPALPGGKLADVGWKIGRYYYNHTVVKRRDERA